MKKCLFKGKGLYCHLFGGKIICNSNCRQCKAYKNGDEMTKKLGYFIAFESDRYEEKKNTFADTLLFLKGWKFSKSKKA